MPKKRSHKKLYKKISSCKKLIKKHEKKILELTSDIRILVENNDPEKITEIKIKWGFIFDIENMIFTSNRELYENYEMQGFLGFINN